MYLRFMATIIRSSRMRERERERERVKRMVYDHQKAKTNDVKGNEGGGEVWLWPPIQSFPRSLSPRRILPHFLLFFIHSLSFFLSFLSLSLFPLLISTSSSEPQVQRKKVLFSLISSPSSSDSAMCHERRNTPKEKEEKKAPQIS